MKVDVAIVGGGPVGLGLAIDLAQRGHSVRVFERTTQLHTVPKGQNLTQRTGEHFRAWQITDAIQSLSPIPRKFGNAGIVLYGNLLSEYHYDWFQRSKVGAYYFAQNERLPQYLTEQVLRDRARELPGLQFDVGHHVIDIDQQQDHAFVSYQREGSTTVHYCKARFVVGCDGARSIVREKSGIEQAVDHQGPKMALLVFRSFELHRLLERYPGKSIFNVMNPELDGYWQFLGRVDLEGGWFYHSPVPDTATVDNYDFKAHLHAFAGTSFELEFEHIGFWDLRISQAKAYRAGRVFIAGDAAHSHPPYGGYGINTGFEDARNLAWKLAAELEGWAGESLLDSYTEERLPVFKSVSRDFIERMITDFRSFLSSYSPTTDKDAFERAWQARTQADDSDVTEFLPNYHGSSLLFDAGKGTGTGTGTGAGEPGAKGVHEVKAVAGYHLAPQPLPYGGDLWDALGSGFTLLDLIGNPATCSAFDFAAEKLGVPLKIVDVSSEALREAYGSKMLLIRPDQFVAWAGSDLDVEAGDILSCAVGNIRLAP